MKIIDHRLCDDESNPVPFKESPNASGEIHPEYCVLHYTAGASAESSVRWLCNPEAKASAHLVIGRDGSITQLVAFDRKAWHAGKSEWRNRVGLNACSIGIELDNCGVLTRHADGWRTAWGRRVDDTQVVEAAHKHGGEIRGWHAYTTSQLEVTTEVATVLVNFYNLKDVIGHEDIARGRKIDPGPAISLASIRDAALGRNDPEESELEPMRAVTTANLNIREGPGTSFKKFPEGPIPKGAKLEVLDRENNWLQVFVTNGLGEDMDVEGWVHGRHVQLVN